MSIIGRANYFRIFFWSGLGIIFGFLLLCFSCFSCFSAFLLFLLFLLLCFSAFLLFCFSCFSPFLLFCFSASPASLLFCFFAFLFFLFLCFSCFSCFSAFLLFLLLCLSAVLLLCVSCFFASLLFCFSAFFALPALNTWFSCKMHFAQYLHPWVSHDQPSLENLQRNMWEEVLAFCFGGAAPSPQSPPPAFFYLNLNPSYISWFLRTNLLWKADRITCDR